MSREDMLRILADMLEDTMEDVVDATDSHGGDMGGRAQLVSKSDALELALHILRDPTSHAIGVVPYISRARKFIRAREIK